MLALWPLAFGPVADADDWRHRFWEQHRTRAEFRLVTAELGGELAGFAWGYTGQRGQWWADRVAGVLGDAADAWVGGHWEFVELAVHPEHRRAGGSLYRRRGWQVIGGLPEGKSVMGKHLPG